MDDLNSDEQNENINGDKKIDNKIESNKNEDNNKITLENNSGPDSKKTKEKKGKENEINNEHKKKKIKSKTPSKNSDAEKKARLERLEKEQSDLKLFRNERKKRMINKTVWQLYSSKLLMNPFKNYFTKEDLKLIPELLFTPLPDDFRKNYWFLMSGAKREKENNPGYYKGLLSIIPTKETSIEFPHEKVIKLDLERTYPEIAYFKDKKNLQKLRNILVAFALRNSVSIGYCQGLNYIAAQLLLFIDNEEDCFWIFTCILEDYMKFDNYLKFSGVRIDMEVMKTLLEKRFPLIKKEMTFILCVNNLISKCFISLFSEMFKMDLLKKILDVFFFYGDVALFKAFFWGITLLCNNEIKDKSIDIMTEMFFTEMKEEKNQESLNYYLLMYNKINKKVIEKLREKNKAEIYEQNKGFTESFMGEGLTKCDKKLPFCVFNHDCAKVENYNEFKIYRVSQNPNIYDTYFFKEVYEFRPLYKKKYTLDNILLERIEHVCS